MSTGVFDLFVSFRVLILFLHVLAVLTWVGGLIYQVIVVAPVAGKSIASIVSLRIALGCEARFRTVMWPAVGIALFTGLVNVMNVWNDLRQGWRQPSGCFRIAAGHQVTAGRGHGRLAGRPAVRGVSQTPGLGGSGNAGCGRAADRSGGLATAAFWLHVATVCLAVPAILCALLLRG